MISDRKRWESSRKKPKLRIPGDHNSIKFNQQMSLAMFTCLYFLFWIHHPLGVCPCDRNGHVRHTESVLAAFLLGLYQRALCPLGF